MNQSLCRSATVGEYLLQAASTWGARIICGVPGTMSGELLAALGRIQERVQLKWVVACDEAAAVFTADGYARVSGSVGLCLTTGGPSATSSATGIVVAHADGVPLLLVVEECPAADSELGALQDLPATHGDSLATFRSISGYCARLEEPASLVNHLKEVTMILSGTRPGTAVLGVSSEIADRPVQLQKFPRCSRSAGRATPPVWRSQFEALMQAQRPLLFLGSGARRALGDPLDVERSARRRRRFVKLAEHHSLPIVTSPRAKGVFPESSAVSLGSFGIAENEWSRRYVHAGIDALTVLGSSLGEWTTGGWQRCLAPKGPLVHVDVRKEVVGRRYSESQVVTADVADYLDALLEFAEQQPPDIGAAKRREVLRHKVRRGPRWLDDDARSSLQVPLKPQRVMSELQAVLNHHNACKEGVNLFGDVSEVLGWAWQHLLLDAPHRFFCNMSRGAPGWASGAVIGGKLARSDIPAIALLSEHELFANGVAISTAAEQRIGAIWLVLVESGPTGEPVSQAPARSAGHNSAQAAKTEDFARALGCHVHEIREPGAVVRRLGEAIEGAALHCLPQVLLVHVDAREKPVFPHWRTRSWPIVDQHISCASSS